MRHSIGIMLAGTLLVSACQVQLQELAPGKKPAPGTATKVAKASPSPSPSATASVAPLVATSASPSAPAEPTTLLKGLVSIDAAYVISTGGGNVISTGGGNVISTGGGNVISTGGGNVISTGGGNVISVGGGNLIGQAGGNVIATGGGNVISTGGGNLRLLADALTIAAGTSLPIRGMVVVPVSLLDDRQVGPAVFTDDQGGYSVTFPEALKGKIRLYAAVPVKDPSEPNFANRRLGYQLLATSKTATTLDLNEESATVTRLVREIFHAKLAAIMTPANLSDGGLTQLGDENALSDDVPAAQKILIQAIASQLTDLLKKHNVPQAQYPVLARRLGDRLLAGLDIYEMQLTKAQAPSFEGTAGPLVPFTVALVKDLQQRSLARPFPADYRQVIAGKIKVVNADYEARNAVITEQNKTLPPEQQKDLRTLRPALKDASSPFVSGRAAEMSDFVITEFMSHGKGEFDNFELVLEDLKQASDPEDYVDKTEVQWGNVGQAFGYYFAMEFVKFSQSKDPATNKSQLELFFETHAQPAN